MNKRKKNTARHIIGLFMAMVMTLLTLNVDLPACEASTLKGPYLIEMSINKKRVVQVNNNDFSNGTNIRVGAADSGTDQLFYLKSEGNGYYTIRSYENSKLVLGLKGGKGYAGCNVKLYRYTGKKGQLWKLKSTGKDHEYYIISKSGGYYLGTSGAHTKSGTNIQVQKARKTKAHRWYFKKAYSASKAIKYALKYTDSSGKYSGGTYNKTYNRFQSDCTNYISQCLYAGGLKQSHTWHRLLKGESCGSSETVSWTLCIELYRHLTKKLHYKVSIVRTVTAKKVKRGDIVFLDTSGNGIPNHATIVTKVSNGRAYYCGHSRWRRNKRYIKSKYKKAFIVHMPS